MTLRTEFVCLQARKAWGTHANENAWEMHAYANASLRGMPWNEKPLKLRERLDVYCPNPLERPIMPG